jgi:diguanylate cyclase (GGDEF)-like protein/PAS domain S-box-containing protein
MKKPNANFQPIPSDQKSNAAPGKKIIEHKQDEKTHINDQYFLDSLMDNIPEHIYFKDIESRFIRISASLAEQFGLKNPSEAIGKTDFDFFSKEHAQLAYEGEQEIIRTGRTLSIEEKETWNGRPDTWVLTTKMPLYDMKGEIIGTFGISKDITARKIADDKLRLQATSLKEQIQEVNLLQDQLRDQATRDALTGLSNRRLMDMVLTQQLAQCKQLKHTFNIVIIDIDNFKDINDNYGHQAGDNLLAKIGNCVLTFTRADDFSARLGGDEILMAFQKMPIKITLKKAETIRKKLGKIFILCENQRISITVSIGISAYPIHGSSVNELISRADEALYIAKEKGKNQVVLAPEVKSN